MWTHDDLREITLQRPRRMGPVPETLEAFAEHTPERRPRRPASCPPRR